MKNSFNPAFYQKIPNFLQSLTSDELKIFTALCLMSPDSRKILISTYDFAMHIKIPWKDVEKGLEGLMNLKLIFCNLDTNPFRNIKITISSQENSKEDCIYNENNIKNIFIGIIEYFKKYINNKRSIESIDKQQFGKKCVQAQHDLNKEAKKPLDSNNSSFAYYLADKLNDQKNLPLYIAYCKKYPKNVLYKAFQKACEIPKEKVRTSRGAIFNYLVQKYSKENNDNDF